MLCLLILIPPCVFFVMAPGSWLTVVSTPHSLYRVNTMVQCVASFRHDTAQTTSQYMVQGHHTGFCGTTFYAGLFFGGKKYKFVCASLC